MSYVQKISTKLNALKTAAKKSAMLLLWLFLLGLLSNRLLVHMYSCFQYENFSASLEESNGFRNQGVSKGWLSFIDQVGQETGLDSSFVMTLLLYDNQFSLGSPELTEADKKLEEDRLLTLYRELMKRKPEELAYLAGQTASIWSDLKYFPVPLSSSNREAVTTFENSWMFERNYGGHRGHEGTDIMASVNRRGYYPVVSMTDGVIEKIGWLNQGGYRIGIRSPHGGYFYYAHLDSYADAFEEGAPVKAGQLIGYMGDSGYGEKEGTVGKFDVHLHIGIYIRTKNAPEMSVNPYWVLKSLEDRRLTYKY